MFHPKTLAGKICLLVSFFTITCLLYTTSYAFTPQPDNSLINDIIEDNSSFGCIATPAFAQDTFPATDNAGIGTTDTKGYKLAVNGNALVTKITVKSYSNCPGYVLNQRMNY